MNSDNICEDSSIKSTPNIPNNLFGRSAQIGQSICYIIEKGNHWASVVGVLNQ